MFDSGRAAALPFSRPARPEKKLQKFSLFICKFKYCLYLCIRNKQTPNTMRVYEEIEPIIKAYKADYPQLTATITDENIVISDPSSIAGDFVEALAAYCHANYVGWIVASVNDIATIIIPNKEI